MQSFGGSFHSGITWAENSLCVLVIQSVFTEMKCTLVKFPTYVIGSSLEEIVKIENTRISN